MIRFTLLNGLGRCAAVQAREAVSHVYDEPLQAHIALEHSILHIAPFSVFGLYKDCEGTSRHDETRYSNGRKGDQDSARG